MHRPPRSAPLFVLGLLGLLLLPARPSRAGDWPFGGSGGMPGLSRGEDLYNLGLLGAKARDADRAPAAAPAGQGVRRVPATGPADPDGPTRLAVQVLFPGGPAETAGLEVGDVIVGLGRRPFREGALPEIAEALRDAASGKKHGEIDILVERPGEEDRRKLTATLPDRGRAAAKPTEGEGRVAIVRAACDWLASRQQADGGFPQTLSGTNGAVVQTALAGLAWLAAGSDLAGGPHQEAVEKSVSFVIENVGETLRSPAGMGGGGNDRLGRMQGMDQTNWGYVHAAIFLGEVLARNDRPRVRAALERCGAEIAKRQEPSGGWAHGPGGPNPLGYTELNIVTGLALCGLGAARQADWQPPAEVIEKAQGYLEASSAGDGGVGYSDQPGQKGMGNIGRTAAAWLGYRTLGLGRSDWGRKMQKWVERNVADVLGGHASLMQHVLLAGLAADALGGRAQRAYWDEMEDALVLALAPDGSLQPTPWQESLQMGTNSDVTFGEVWTTAAWTIVLAGAVDEDGLPGLPVWTGA